MGSKHLAQDDFERAYRMGFWRKVITWLTGESNQLLPFKEVRESIPLQGEHYVGLQQVSINQIVGSLGRYRDFDRAFIPLQTNTKERWVRVDEAHYEDVLLPPVDLYKMGEVYFVVDGNHRVSVARNKGQEFIDAYVIELVVPVSLTPDVDLGDLEIKGEYAAFLEKTNIEEIRPGVKIEFTLPGEYKRALEHINVHRWYLGEERDSDVPFGEAVASWCDNIYQPLVDVIREYELVESFPGRTEADLFLWVSEYEWYLLDAYRKGFSFEEATSQFRQQCVEWPAKKLVRRLKKAAWVDNLILEQEQEEFQSRTHLRGSRPKTEITLTTPGLYFKLLDQIIAHRHYLNDHQKEEMPFDQAAASWHDHVYLPLVNMIREQEILEEFPGRTETDLYVWIVEHQEYLERTFEDDVPFDLAIRHFTEDQI